MTKNHIKKETLTFQINSRSNFDKVLAETTGIVRKLHIQTPDYSPFETILCQLEAMAAWTANNHNPTKKERESIDMDLIAVRELNDYADLTIRDVVRRLYELSAYFRDWPPTD